MDSQSIWYNLELFQSMLGSVRESQTIEPAGPLWAVNQICTEYNPPATIVDGTTAV